jgi:dTDP-4-dehydrorhamnose 3,5-epimerase
MIFTAIPLAGAYLVTAEPKVDARGFFARSWCREEARKHGIDVAWVQSNISFSHRRGTLRGMHYQAPDWEAKLVRVTQGSIFDVIVDLRASSPTYMQHFSVVLSAAERNMLFVPQGLAHGFLSLEDGTEIFYEMSEFYRPDQARGFRFDDPQFAIAWPSGEKILSDRDRSLPCYSPCADPVI